MQISKNKFIENFFSLTALRVLTLVVPLVTYPYLIRVLGSERYGLVMWAWSIVTFFILFINFGFNLSVTKYIAIQREDKAQVSSIVFTALATKIFLFFISLFIFSILIFSIPKLADNKDIFFYTFLLTIGEMLMPIWYFQGIEKMRYTAIITSFVKLFFTLLVFVVIQKQSDYLKVPVLYALSSIISALFAYYIIFYKHQVYFVKPKIKDIIFYIKDSSALFFSSSISVLKDSLTIVFIEYFIGLSAVAYFDIVQKFVNILITPFHIVSSVLYPHISKTKDFILLKKTIIYTVFATIILYILTYFMDAYIVKLLYGKESKPVEELLIILSASIIFANVASLLGTNGLVVMGRNKQLFLSTLYGLIFFIFILTTLVIFSKLTVNYVAYAILIAYVADMTIRSYFIKDMLWQK